MPFSTPYPTCIWCGARANSREHAIPKWMSKQLKIKGFLRGNSHGITARRQPISFASHRARIFCEPCNTHFKHLEDAAIPLLVPMAKGRTLSLGDSSRELLSLWASKTAVALLAAQAPELREIVPHEHRLAIREHGRPSDETWVGYFPWSGPQSIGGGEAIRGEHSNLDPTHKRQLYVSVFTFRRLGFKVVGIIDRRSRRWAVNGSQPLTHQFWPPVPGLMHWPPRTRPVTEEDRITAGIPMIRERGYYPSNERR